MTHRERVLAALSHRETDRPPFMYRDVPEVRARLKKDLNLKTDDALFEYFDIDFRWVAPEYVGNKIISTDDYRKDIWGVEWKYTRFNPDAGYWNEISHPLIAVDDPKALDDYPWPVVSDWDFSKVGSRCDQYAGYAIMTAPGIASPGLFQSPIQHLTGIARSFTDPFLRPEFFEKLIEKILAFHLPFIDAFFTAANGKIDFFRIGDDFGTQQGLLMDVDTWKNFFQPAFKQMAGMAKKHGAHYYQHSCGAVRDLIPAFIETGVEVLDPLQVSANGMIPAELKECFGQLITFSGGVDEQQLLPFGTPNQVKEETKNLVRTMSKDGGFFLGPTHNFQEDIPTENIVAMYDAAKEI